MKKLLQKNGIPILLAILFCLIGTVSFITLTHMQGNARVINYTGIIRGATQRLIKQEMNNQPNDELIRVLDDIVMELSTGIGSNNLTVIHDKIYQDYMAQMRLSWDGLKTEIDHVRQGSSPQNLYRLSEDYFELSDRAVSAAEQYSEKRVNTSIFMLAFLSICFTLLFLLLWASSSRRRKAQMDLTLAKSASQSKSDFLSRMSHEIRTPLNGIVGMTAIARRSADNREKVLNCLDKIDLSSSYLMSLLNDVLDMSRIESGKIELEYSEFELSEICDQIYDLFWQKAEDNGISLQIDRGSQTAQRVIGDHLRLTQVLVNLTSNAMKFTPSGGTVSLMIRQTSEDQETVSLEFTVMDTGVGISEEFQSRLFEPFEQESAGTARQYGGTGLGLAISNNFVKMMGGNISVWSRLGEGTRFTVQLTLKRGAPVEKDRAGANTASGLTDPDTPVSEDLSGLTILLAEDNEINAEIITCILEEGGAKVDSVGDGKAVVEKFTEASEGTYQLIFMDIRMPVLDGMEACRAIRTSGRADAGSIPIIGLSANAFREDIDKAMASGMNAYLAKPIDLKLLYQTLDRVLS